MPTVLHIISGLTAGGAETALLRLITSSRGTNYTHQVVTLTTGGVMRNRFHEAGIDVTDLDFKRSPISHFLYLRSLIRKRRPDIVQTWMYHADVLGGLAACLAGNRKIVWGIRTTSVASGGGWISVLQWISAKLSWWMPSAIVCVADTARRSHIECGYDAGRMTVVHNGFDPATLAVFAAQRAALRQRCGFGPRQVVIGTSGRFDLDKDHHNFVCAARQLARQYEQVRFLMVGDGLDARNAKLAEWIDRTGYADRFVLMGERDDALAYLAAMDIFCLPSRNEGFPNVVGEAMALGVPCVVTDVGDAAALVADTGIVVPREDAEALANGLARMMEQTTDARNDLAGRARRRIHEEFTMTRTRERFEKIYRHVTEGAK